MVHINGDIYGNHTADNKNDENNGNVFGVGNTWRLQQYAVKSKTDRAGDRD